MASKVGSALTPQQQLSSGRPWRLPVKGLLLSLCCSRGAIVAAQPQLPPGSSACAGIPPLRTVQQAQQCAEEAAQAGTEMQAKQLRKILGSMQELRDACPAGNERSTVQGCQAVSDLTYEMFGAATSLLRICQVMSPQDCDERGREAALDIMTAWHITETRFKNTPAETMVVVGLNKIRQEVFDPFATDERVGDGLEALPPAWNVSMRAIDKLRHWNSGYIWRETHWLWLQDSLQAGRVVQTTWGDADEWLQKFGVHDAHVEAPLSLPGPRYAFSDLLGMRWNILTDLLKDLHQRRGGQGMLQVVEIGVFAGMLSNFLLRDCPFIHLLGIDPYVGSDGTFPGNFSDTLDPDVALYKAASVMQEYGDRGVLWPTTSEVATKEIEDGSIDAVFIDGCHLYECVKQDLELWIPKMRRGVPVLVAGHDFSPQWPGVVRAVHEHRGNGGEVTLASDWMFWWFDQY